MGGELKLLDMALELGSAARESSLAGARLAEEAMPSLNQTVAAVARRSGLVHQSIEFPIANEAETVSGSLKFNTDGTSILNDGQTSKILGYRKADDLFFLHEQGSEPHRISQTFQRGFLQNEGASAFAPIDRSQPMIASVSESPTHGWDRLSPKQLDAIRAAVPDGSIPVGLGSKRQAWLPPSSDHAVVFGPKFERPDVPKLLKPSSSEVIGDKQLEWFKYGESDSVTRADVAAVNHEIRLSGWHPDDSFTANYVRLMDGGVWRVDPEDLYRMTNKSWNEYLAKFK